MLGGCPPHCLFALLGCKHASCSCMHTSITKAQAQEVHSSAWLGVQAQTGERCAQAEAGGGQGAREGARGFNCQGVCMVLCVYVGMCVCAP